MDNNQSANETEFLKRCPFLHYCMDGFRAQAREVCEGQRGDYRKCGVYLHLMEEDAIKENTRALWRHVGINQRRFKLIK